MWAICSEKSRTPMHGPDMFHPTNVLWRDLSKQNVCWWIKGSSMCWQDFFTKVNGAQRDTTADGHGLGVETWCLYANLIITSSFKASTTQEKFQQPPVRGWTQRRWNTIGKVCWWYLLLQANFCLILSYKILFKYLLPKITHYKIWTIFP